MIPPTDGHALTLLIPRHDRVPYVAPPPHGDVEHAFLFGFVIMLGLTAPALLLDCAVKDCGCGALEAQHILDAAQAREDRRGL
jgi:hypothetical protein